MHLTQAENAQGLRYGDLFKYFVDATVMGLYEQGERRVRVNPGPDEVVGPDDELIIIRPTSASAAEYVPLDVPVLTDPGAESVGLVPFCSSRDLMHATTHASGHMWDVGGSWGALFAACSGSAMDLRRTPAHKQNCLQPLA